jgi:hypothetical protein
MKFELNGFGEMKTNLLEKNKLGKRSYNRTVIIDIVPTNNVKVTNLFYLKEDGQ